MTNPYKDLPIAVALLVVTILCSGAGIYLMINDHFAASLGFLTLGLCNGSAGCWLSYQNYKNTKR